MVDETTVGNEMILPHISKDLCRYANWSVGWWLCFAQYAERFLPGQKLKMKAACLDIQAK
jgi:hypothetical protein